LPVYVITDKSGTPLAGFDKKYRAKHWWEDRPDKNSLRIFVETKTAGHNGRKCTWDSNGIMNFIESIPNLVEKDIIEYFS
jgi:hypothetical protein